MATKSKSQRPIIITVVCLFLLLGLLVLLSSFVISSVRDQIVAQYGSFFLVWMGLQVVIGAGALVGFWRMQKWGLYLYALNFVLGIVATFIFSHPVDGQAIGFVIPLIVLGIGYYYRDQMA